MSNHDLFLSSNGNRLLIDYVTAGVTTASSFSDTGFDSGSGYSCATVAAVLMPPPLLVLLMLPLLPPLALAIAVPMSPLCCCHCLCVASGYVYNCATFAAAAAPATGSSATSALTCAPNEGWWFGLTHTGLFMIDL